MENNPGNNTAKGSYNQNMTSTTRYQGGDKNEALISFLYKKKCNVLPSNASMPDFFTEI